MMTNVVDCPFDELRIGMALTVLFRPESDEITVPVFRPAVNGAGSPWPMATELDAVGPGRRRCRSAVAPPHRREPALLDRGAEGELRFLRCQDCGYWIHPPPPVCPKCLSRNLASRRCRAGRRCTRSP